MPRLYTTTIPALDLRARLTERQLKSLVLLDCASMRSPEELRGAIASHLVFPDYYGSNWDAFDECACDLSWLQRDVFLALLNVQALASYSSKALGMLVAILSRLGEDSAESRHGFLREVCFHTTDSRSLLLVPELASADKIG